MGNTIRREPVNFSIPASPDYKFLNITNFRGLDISSNPFELATNTASDCLNVYVDETNTLTTRPRLEKKELKDGSGKDILPLVGRCIGIYPLHDGYLFHWSHRMKILHGDKLKDVLVETMPLSPCKCFEQGDKTYLLGEGRYMVIDENGILSDVEGYVPNTSIVRLDGTREKDEAINLLSDTYTEKYFWDIDSEIDLSGVDYVNTSYDRNDLGFYGDGSELFYEWDYDPSDLNTITHLYIKYKETPESTPETVVDLVNRMTVSRSLFIYRTPKTKVLWLQERESGDVAVVYLSNTTWKTKIIKDTIPSYSIYTLSDTGLMAAYRASDAKSVGVLQLDETLTTYSNKTITPETSIISVALQNDILLMSDGARLYVSQDNENTTRLFANKFISNLRSYGITGTAGVFAATKDLFYLSDFSGTNTQTQTIDFDYKHIKSFSDYDYSLWYFDNNYDIWVIPDAKNINKNHIKVGVGPSVKPVRDMSNAYFHANKYIYLSYYDTNSTPHAEGYKRRDDRTANIIATHRLQNEDAYDEWETKRKSLLRSTLFTRFDNNYWFASENTCFWSNNNDPTYFPITEYGELGDSNEEITGFNIANDTTLLAYKTNRLYLIQPFYSETTGMNEYSITESKNTVGNTAIDAPIITTLTETPIQINYDGIYGLSQVSNVSAVERIADLMSEPINDMWLNEDDDVIKKAQTLNRLYWTYIILPYTKESKVDPRDVCKVYLLDNRTNSWYYWELPINLLNAFTKDNRAEFVDTEGNIYYLTTTDIRNMGFDTQLITEYYDYGKKLIPWHWQSQALYLGTMNHAKRLVNTTFILTDTDTQDGYGLQYSFKVFRKLASSVPEKELSGDLNLVRSTTKKTNISKFGFLQLKLSNITEDSQGTEAEKAYRNNKLRLVGLGLKYVLLEGLIR